EFAAMPPRTAPGSIASLPPVETQPMPASVSTLPANALPVQSLPSRSLASNPLPASAPPANMPLANFPQVSSPQASAVPVQLSATPLPPVAPYAAQSVPASGERREASPGGVVQ